MNIYFHLHKKIKWRKTYFCAKCRLVQLGHPRLFFWYTYVCVRVYVFKNYS